MKIFKIFKLLLRKNFFKVISIVFILILVFICLPQIALPQTTSVEYICAGTDYETPAYIIQTNYKKPAILIIAGTHGNELAGIRATQYLKDNIKIERGTLIIIPRANILACDKNVRNFPSDVNLNRVYPGKSEGNEVERLAYKIFDLAKRYDIDLLVDLHESIEFYKNNSQNYGQTLVIDSNDDYLFNLSSSIVEEMNKGIFDNNNKYQVLVKPIEGSAAYSAYYQLNIPAFTFETCRKLPLAFRIQEHIRLVKIILFRWNMIAVEEINNQK